MIQNPCEQCVYQNQSWNSEPCYKCGADNDYVYCKDADGNLIDTSSYNSFQKLDALNKGAQKFGAISENYNEMIDIAYKDLN